MDIGHITPKCPMSNVQDYGNGDSLKPTYGTGTVEHPLLLIAFLYVTL